MVLYHWDWLWEEKGIWPIKRLEWKSPMDPEFIKHVNCDWLNVGVLVPEKLKTKAEKMMERVPFRLVLTYEDIEDVKRIAMEPWHRILRYYDVFGSGRGSLFGERWRSG